MTDFASEQDIQRAVRALMKADVSERRMALQDKKSFTGWLQAVGLFEIAVKVKNAAVAAWDWLKDELSSLFD